VPVQVRAQLEAARARGESFDDAWRHLVSVPNFGPVKFSHNTAIRHRELAALHATVEEWRAAYEGRATALSVALSRAAKLDEIIGIPDLMHANGDTDSWARARPRRRAAA
jgi:hypothetical protein